MKKIVVLDGYTLNPGDLSWSELEKLGDLKVYDRTPAGKVIERIGDADYVYTNKTPITKETLDSCTNIKFIGVLATGYNIVDFAHAREKNIDVCNVPTYGTASVSQYVFALLLNICHHISEHSASVFDGVWEKSEDFCYWNFPLIELASKTMGIIGFGKIGQDTAKIANSMGMKVLAFDAHKNPALENENCKYVELDVLLEKSDVISLHCPLFPSTEGIINKDSISKMKNGVIIINTSRGPLIVEQDLADALNSDKVFAAATDVVSTEPIKSDNPLLKAKNMTITPHIAWAPIAARTRLMDVAINNLKEFIVGNPINVVNT